MHSEWAQRDGCAEWKLATGAPQKALHNQAKGRRSLEKYVSLCMSFLGPPNTGPQTGRLK